MECKLYNLSAFLSTNLNSKIATYKRLADRILRQLGAPVINVEVARDCLYEYISIACDTFTKYAGLEQQYLVFNSGLYQPHKGIRLDELFSIRDQIGNTPYQTQYQKEYNITNNSTSVSSIVRNSSTFNSYLEVPSQVYICTSTVYLSNINISSINKDITPGKIINQTMYDVITNELSGGNPELSSNFTPSWVDNLTLNGEESPNPIITYNNCFDYDIMDYRKVNAVNSLDLGESTGINTLFTIEQTLAQQTYFSYAMGNYGFDLISWYILKNWLDTREKLLSINPAYQFNNRTQYLTIIPEPRNNESQYWAVISCWVEKPLRDILKEIWVQQYALALSKIGLSNIRGKFQNLSLFGSGSLNYSDLMNQGSREKEALEKELYEGSTPGLGSQEPPMFFIG